jgi:hypothetical protein
VICKASSRELGALQITGLRLPSTSRQTVVTAAANQRATSMETLLRDASGMMPIS